MVNATQSVTRGRSPPRLDELNDTFQVTAKLTRYDAKVRARQRADAAGASR